jgi:membrane protease YdiL (CAAX protease family)
MKTRVIQSESEMPTASRAAGASEGAAPTAKGLRALIRRQPLVAFFVLAFAITWAPVPVGSFMAAGPLLAALIVTGVVDGRRGLRALWRRMIHWRVGWQWYAAALLIPLGVEFASGGLAVAVGAPGSAFGKLSVSSVVLLFALRLVVPIMSPVGEEPGWRGFALPRFLAERSAFEGTLILAAVVALWHVPLVFIASENLPPLFLVATFAITFFYTWLFVRTGSVLITIVAHATEGLIGRTLSGTGGFAGSDKTHWILIYTAAWCLVAAAVVVLDPRVWWSRGATRTPRAEAMGQLVPAGAAD